MKGLKNDFLDCIYACNECVTAVKLCLYQHMGESDMKQCHLYCLDCVELCTACSRLLAGNSGNALKICTICAELCQKCADECAKFDSEICKQCAEKCAHCAAVCNKLAA